MKRPILSVLFAVAIATVVVAVVVLSSGRIGEDKKALGPGSPANKMTADRKPAVIRSSPSPTQPKSAPSKTRKPDSGNNQSQAQAESPSVIVPPASDSEREQRMRRAYREIRRNPDLRSYLKDGKTAFRPTKLVTGELMETAKFQQYYQGIEVVGAMVMHHRSANGVSIQSNLPDLRGVDIHPSLTPEQALAIAKGMAREVNPDKLLMPPQLKIFPADDTASPSRLVYWFSPKLDPSSPLPDLNAYEVIVDAHTGHLVATIPLARRL